MPGRMNGIEAAKIITDELDIPVVFVTSYADDAIIEKAKNVRPYGYIVKPFNELEIKAAIEVALFRKGTERLVVKKGKKSEQEKIIGADAGQVAQEDFSYHDLPEIKTVLLHDIFTGIVLYLYTEHASKEPLFKFALEEGIKKGGRNLFAYSESTLRKYFLKEIQKKDLYTHRIKRNEIYTLIPVLEKCTESLMNTGTPDSLHIFLDFSETEEFDDILAIRNLLLSKKEKKSPVSGIIALNIGKIDHMLLKTLSEGISRIIVSTGKETTLLFSHETFPVDAVSVVPQSTIDNVVKKSLEPVVLSLLDKPVSGYDIVHEIHNRYNVFIPQARIYTILHDLEDKGFLEIRISGKSKLFCSTEKGKKHISQTLGDFKQVFQHILSNQNGAGTDGNDTEKGKGP
jgi:two-component system, response regulator PdtaR